MHFAGLRRPTPSRFKKHWILDPGVVFLNHGSFGACPKEVLLYQDDLRREMESEPVRFLWRTHDARLQEARLGLAGFLGANPRDLSFVTNATTAVNAVVRSWPLRKGDEILTTNLDYNACRNVLVETARAIGAKVVVAQVPFPLRSVNDLMESILAAVTSHTRFAMIDHVTSNSALVLPVARLVRELEKRGIRTLVDGAHAPGMLALDLAKIRATWYTGNLHKWVCAPKGAAFLWVRKDAQQEIQPAVVSHGNNSPREGFPAWQDRFDWAGTFDSTAWFSVPKAVEVIGKFLPGGWSEVRKSNRDLTITARNAICGALEVEPPCPESMLGSMATIPFPARFQNISYNARMAPEQIRLFEEFGIEIPVVKIGELRAFRISAHLHNSLAEYHYLARAILRI